MDLLNLKLEERVKKDILKDVKGLNLDGTYFAEELPLYFDFNKIIHGRVAKYCYPIRLTKDKENHWKRIKALNAKLDNLQLRSFANDKRTIEQILGLQRDPETLDDSDIDILIDTDSNGQNLNDIQNNKDNDITGDEGNGNIEIMSDMNDINIQETMIQTNLMISNGSFFEVGTTNQQLLYHGIRDCKIFHNTYDKSLNDTVLITQKNGYLIRIIPQANPLDQNIVLQHWYLGNGEWDIIKSDFDSEQFITINKKLGKLKFFKFINPLHFQLINNLTLDNTTIIDCVFLNNTVSNSDDRHYIIFLLMIRFERLVYFCIEWEGSTPENKSVHQLTLLNNEIPTGCVPIGSNNNIVYSNNRMTIVSANQIMSGETTFKNIRIRELKGIKAYFQAPMLLKKLKRLNEIQFATFEYCTIISTTTGNVCVCLSNTQEIVKFYLLTRFKGLRSICPITSFQNNDKGTSDYYITVISFGRTLQLKLNLSEMIELSETKRISNSKLSLNGVVFKHTLDSSSEENTDLLLVPSRISNQSSELWLTSPMAISNLRIGNPVRKVHTICKLQQFQLFNKFDFIDYSNIPSSFKNTLFDGIESDDNKELILMLASDSLSFSKVFILQLSNTDQELLQIDDLLCDSNADTLLCFFTSINMVQVTQTTVYVESLYQDGMGDSSSSMKRSFNPGCKIDGVSSQGNKLIVWSYKENKVWYIDDINTLESGSEFKETLSFKEIISSQMFDIQIDMINEDDISVNNACKLTMINWTDMINNNVISADLLSSESKFPQFNEHNTSYLINEGQIVFYNIRKKLTKYNVASSELIEAKLYYNFDNMTIRFIKNNTYLMFSPNHISIIDIRDSDNPHLYDIKLPYNGKFNPILDVKVYQSSERIFILYADGLHVYELSYFTWNNSNYLLKSTRNLHKTFLYINKLNRMIVVNLDTKEWDCIKLSNGKTLSLDVSLIDSEPRFKLLSVLELPVKEDTSGIYLLVIFESLVKLIKVTPSKRNIIVTEVTSHDFNCSLNKKVVVKTNGYFYVMTKGISDHNETSDKQDTLYCMSVSHESFIIISKLDFNGGGLVTDFDICQDDVMFTNTKWDRLFYFKDIRKMSMTNKPHLLELKLAESSYVTKILAIDDDTFVVSTRCEGRSSHVAELLYYKRADIKSKNKIDSGTFNNLSTHNDLLIYDQVSQTDSEIDIDFSGSELEDGLTEEQDELERESDSDHDNVVWNTQEILDEPHVYDNEMYGDEAFQRPIIEPEMEVPIVEETYGVNNLDDVNSTSETDLSDFDDNANRFDNHIYTRDIRNSPRSKTTAKRPSDIVYLDKLVKNMTYDDAEDSLYVLTNDQSVLQFIQKSNANDSLSLNRYNIPKEKPISVGSHITESGLWLLDEDGQLNI